VEGPRPRVLLLAAIAVFSTLAAPSPAEAHLRSSRVAVDFRARVSPLRPPLAGAVELRVYESDLALGLTIDKGHKAVVLGYLGEPLLRIGPQGLEVNAASTTAAGTGLLKGMRRSSRAGPDWRLQSDKRSVVWHDARVRGLPSGAKHGRWALPLEVDGRHGQAEGEIWHVPAPSPWPWLALGVALAAVPALLLAVGRKPLLRPAAACLGVVAAGATLATAAGLAAASSSSQGAWIEGANEAVFALVGLAFVARGSADARALAGGALGLLGVSVGLSKLPILLHGVVFSALPVVAARAAVVLAISAGAAATVIGLVVFFDVLEHYEEPGLSSAAAGRSEGGDRTRGTGGT
jgi:hypothetical protein